MYNRFWKFFSENFWQVKEDEQTPEYAENSVFPQGFIGILQK